LSSIQVGSSCICLDVPKSKLKITFDGQQIELEACENCTNSVKEQASVQGPLEMEESK
jgi:hypothetical protein